MTLDSQSPTDATAARERPTPNSTTTTSDVADSAVAHTRAAAVWVGVIVSALLLIALIIFIAQNAPKVTTHFLGYDGSTSLGVTVLIAAVVGALLVAIPGTVRIMQLRHTIKKNGR